jgi:hypothetical protein
MSEGDLNKTDLIVSWSFGIPSIYLLFNIFISETIPYCQPISYKLQTWEIVILSSVFAFSFVGVAGLFIGLKRIDREFEEQSQIQNQIREQYQKSDYKKSNICKTCESCKNYHGHKYNSIILVCAIHPYGVNTDNCLDYISVKVD